MKGSKKNSSGKSGGHKGGPSGESKSWDTKDRVGCAVESDTGRQSVDQESLVPKRKMPTSDEVDNQSQRRMEKSEECGSCGSRSKYWAK